jgi:hypothetical protein
MYEKLLANIRRQITLHMERKDKWTSKWWYELGNLVDTEERINMHRSN